MQLTEFIGKQVLIHIKPIGKAQEVKLLGVEVGGVWVESQKLTNEILEHFSAQSSANSPVFFFPYNEIQMIFSAIPIPGLNEKSFDV
jgi:hypothetical protein